MPSATLSATPTSSANWRAPGSAANAFAGTGRFFGAAAMGPRQRLEGDVRLLQRDHHLAEVRAGRAGLEALRQLVRIPLNAVHLVDRRPQQRAEVRAAGG